MVSIRLPHPEVRVYASLEGGLKKYDDPLY
jgi:hypothetical protein